MKKSGFLFFAVLFFFASQTKAQSLHIGVKAGVNLAEINGRSFSGGFQPGFTAGGFVELGINSKWTLQPELLYTQTRANTSAEFPLCLRSPVLWNSQPDGILELYQYSSIDFL